MKKINILVLCYHTEILATIVRLICQNPSWEGIPANDEQEALAQLQATSVDLLLLGSGIPEEVEQRLQTFATAHCPNTKIVQHYGGGSGLLSGEIMEALLH